MKHSLNQSYSSLPGGIRSGDLSREEVINRVWESCAQHKGFNEGFQKAVGQFQFLITGLFISFTLYGLSRGLQQEELEIYFWTIEEPSLPFLSRSKTTTIAEAVEEISLTVNMVLIGFLFFSQFFGVFSPGGA